MIVSIGAVSCYPVLMVNLIWFANENVYRVSTKQHRDMKSGVLQSKNVTILQAWCASALSCSNMWKSNYPHRHVNAIALHVLWLQLWNFKNLSSANQIFHCLSRVAIDSTSWDYQACTRDTLWCQHYVTTSEEYLINCHILLHYFELVFLQLQLVKIVCKLIIIWVNYEQNKRGSHFYETLYMRPNLY